MDDFSKEELYEIRDMHASLEHEMKRRASLFNQVTVTAIDTTKDKVKTSPTDKRALLMATLADLDTRIEQATEELNGKKQRALRFFKDSELTREEYEVMYYRFIACLEWEDIYSIMYWSGSYIQSRYRIAMRKLFPNEASENKLMQTETNAQQQNV